MDQLLYLPNSLKCCWDNQAIPMGSDQFHTVMLSGGWQDATTHQRDHWPVAGTEMSKAKAVTDLVRDGALLILRRKQGESGIIDSDPAGHYVLGAGRIRHNSQVVVKSFDLNRGGCEPQPPQCQRDQHHVLKHGFHATPASQPRGPGVR